MSSDDDDYDSTERNWGACWAMPAVMTIMALMLITFFSQFSTIKAAKARSSVDAGEASVILAVPSERAAPRSGRH